MTYTGIVTDNRYLDHETGDGHPENPYRLKRIYSRLKENGLKTGLVEIAPREALIDELVGVHSPDYLKLLAATACKAPCALTPDTMMSEGSYLAALLSAGGMMEAIDSVMKGTVTNAFVLARPPGHHAEYSRAMGYCLLNNVALGAVHARKLWGVDRVLIVDWDVHHGNGTQHAFETDPSVLFFSIHQYPHFPGTGLYTENGIGRGEGYTVNIPISKGYGDGEYIEIFRTVLPVLAEKFKPGLILVSAGFDTHSTDPLGGMKMTTRGFAGLTRCLMDVASMTCDGKLVMCLEGGYATDALADSVAAVLMEMSGATTCRLEQLTGKASAKKIDHAVKRLIHMQGPFWRGLISLGRHSK
jgi:acetoin utilization deacetylase AcuC-like enzyme